MRTVVILIIIIASIHDMHAQINRIKMKDIITLFKVSRRAYGTYNRINKYYFSTEKVATANALYKNSSWGYDDVNENADEINRLLDKNYYNNVESYDSKFEVYDPDLSNDFFLYYPRAKQVRLVTVVQHSIVKLDIHECLNSSEAHIYPYFPQNIE